MLHNTSLDSANPNNETEDVLSQVSSRPGIAGIIETFLRRFRILSYIIALIPLYMVVIIAMGLSASPGVYFFSWVLKISTGWNELYRLMSIGMGFVTAYFIYGFTLIFVIPLFNWLIPLRIKPFRGSFFSLQSIPWYIHNALTYIVRYTFLEFITPTPLNILFFRLMGMKIGKGVHINTSNISDPALIEIGDYVTIGGSAHIMAHYGQKGYLIVEKVKIHAGVNIGLKASIMGDSVIGENAVIAPHEVILPRSRLEANRKPEK